MKEIIISIAYLIFLIALSGCGGILLGNSIDKITDKVNSHLIKLGIGIGMILAAVIFSILCLQPKSPSALDVYRGNTVLKVISIDNEPIDTVVLFKKNKYGN